MASSDGTLVDAATPSRVLDGGRPRDFLALMKPRVMSLVLFTALVGVMLAPGEPHPVIALTALLCIAVGAGASGAINMWYDADIDAAMARTAGRPIPTGRIAPGEALGFGVTLAIGAILVMGLLVNLTAALLLAFTIAFYVFVYTIWLKRRTPLNIVIGGAAGAFPPMVGWAAAGEGIGLGAIVLFAMIFFWTPPHFWALSLYRADDYAKAGVPMLPVVAGTAETRRQILIYSLILVPLTLVPCLTGLASTIYGTGAAVLGTGFLALAIKVWRTPDGVDAPARRLFGYSILYLFLLFALLLAERLLGGMA